MNTELKNTLVKHATEFTRETVNYKEVKVPNVELAKLASSLYEIDWVKVEFKNIMLNFKKEFVYPDVKTVMTFIKKIITHSRTINLPTTFGTRDVFETLIENMGMEIFVWLKQVWFKLEKFDKINFENLLNVYLNHLYFTITGRLDYEKIVHYIIDHPEHTSEFTRFFEMSVFSFEEKLKEWYHRVKKEVVDFISHLIHERCRVIKSTDNKVENEYDYYLLAYWHYRLVNDVTHVTIDDLIGEYGRTFDHAVVDNNQGEGNMLALSAFYGHHLSVKYFWNRMIEEERNIYILETIKHMSSDEDGFKFNGCRRETSTFLFRMMNVHRWETFLEALHQGDIPLMLLAVIYSMQYREFYFPTLDTIKIYIPKSTDLTTLTKERVFKDIVLFYDFDFELTHEGKRMKEIIQQIFKLSDYKLH